MKARILAGDLPKDATLLDGGRSLHIRYRKTNPGFFDMPHEIISVIHEAVAAEQITQENQNSMLPRLGFGLAGGILLGPLGLLAGVLGSGQKTEVCFSCELRDGRKFIATCCLGSWQMLHAKLAFATP